MKIRVKFRKYGNMKFIGHLDVMRYFQKALRRAQVDICYSAGYSPHPIMSFAAPLGLGLTSNGEYMDIEVNQTEDSCRMIDRLNAVMVDGMEVTAFRRLPDDAKSAMSLIAAADYRVEIRPGHDRPAVLFDCLAEQLSAFRSLPQVLVHKKTKKSETEVDLLPMIYDLREDPAVPGSVFIRLASGSAENLKPELVMEALYRQLGLTPNAFDFMVHRYEMYARNPENGELISLADLGEDLLEQETNSYKES